MPWTTSDRRGPGDRAHQPQRQIDPRRIRDTGLNEVVGVAVGAGEVPRPVNDPEDGVDDVEVERRPLEEVRIVVAEYSQRLADEELFVRPRHRVRQAEPDTPQAQPGSGEKDRSQEAGPGHNQPERRKPTNNAAQAPIMTAMMAG